MQEEAIILRCRQGDVDAFRQVYERYNQALLHTAVRMLGNQDDAEDAVQTTFVKLYDGVRRFRFESRFSTYLFRILFNVCFDFLQRRKRHMEPLDIVTLSSPCKQDVRAELHQAISMLPGQQKACFILFAIEELPQSEIADILSLSIGGVKSNIFQAKKKLRELLADDTRGRNR